MLIRFAQLALVAFAATMGFDRPSPPVRAHAAWADLAMLACAAATFAAVAARQTALSTGRGALWPALAYVAWAAICAALHGGWIKVIGIAELACVLVCTATLARDATVRARLMRAWIAGAAALALIGLCAGIAAGIGAPIPGLHSGGGVLRWAFRPGGMQRTGLLAAIVVVPLLACVADAPALATRLRRTLIAVFAVTLVACATRSVFAAAAGLLVLKVRPRRAAIGTVVLVAAAFASVALDGALTDGRGPRARVWREAVRTVAEQPFTGVGPDGGVAVLRNVDDGAPVAWDAHSTVLDLVGHFGLPGLVAFVLLFARVASVTSSRFYRAALVATAIDAITIDLEDFRHVWLLFGLAVAARDADASPDGPRRSADSAV